MFITISREYGAGGSSVARLVADRLRWRLVDNQLVDEVARRAGMSSEDVAHRQERGPSFIERMARALATASPELMVPDDAELPEAAEVRLARITEQVVADACMESNAVLVGRAAVAVLAQRQDALHVRLVGSAEFRAGVVMDRDKIGRQEALKRLKEIDANRARYHQQFYSRDWHNPVNYHVTINTGLVGLERATDIVVAAAWPLLNPAG